MFTLKNVLAILLLLISSSVWAFMPATGMWGVDSEDNGLPGRGFQIQAENGVMVLTYFGYRADGSSTFYYASNRIENPDGIKSTPFFFADLLDLHGGTPIGGPYHSASLSNPISVGIVSINFTNGTHGYIQLPGEPSIAISTRPFGYADGPAGLKGEWLFTFIKDQIPSSRVETLKNLPIGANGLPFRISDDARPIMAVSNEFVCEVFVDSHLIDHVDLVRCTDNGFKIGTIEYRFRVSGDRGTGEARVYQGGGVFGAPFPAYMDRIRTGDGLDTGLNEPYAFWLR